MSAAVSAASAVALAVLAILGVLIRFMLVPYLREQIVKPVAETNRAVTDSPTGQSNMTLPDQVNEVLAALEQNTAETLAVARMFEGHLESSDTAHTLLQRDVDRLWTMLQLRNAEHREHGETDRGDTGAR